MRHSIKKILIANRGEIAVRVIRTCRELGIRSVAVYSEADRAMPHVWMADEAVPIGAPPASQSYLNSQRIIEAARAAGADAIHPGYGFLSENASFAQSVADAGILFIGPSPASIFAMGDKTEAKRLAASAGVPVVPGTEGAVRSSEEARDFCMRAGFPVLLKAAAGGGGRGMRIVHSAEELPSSFTTAQSEARSSFGDDRVYVERYLTAPRHIEFQIMGDMHGGLVHLGERECSIQRRHQKVIEETPSAALTEELRSRMGETALTAARACGYYNAGTVEFLLDEDGRFYFLEMNTRLQVEHPVTELRTGLDIVALQIQVASGEPLPFDQSGVSYHGHAMECRICAEDPLNNFAPATGRILQLRPAGGAGIRDDRGIGEGGEISVYYDSMIAKLVAWAPSRHEAITRMRRALGEYVILGVPTNIGFCRFVLDHPAFVTGAFDTHFVPRYYRPEALGSPDEQAAKAMALLAATIVEDDRRSSLFTAGTNGTGQRTEPGNRAMTGWGAQRFERLR